MGSFYNDASLVMIPSGYKDQKVYCAKPADGSGDLVFSRASSATRVQSDGLIEKVRTNLVLQSNGFSTVNWAKSGSGLGLAPVVTANAGTAPDGTNTASRVVFNCVGVTSLDRSILNQGVTSANSTPHASSVFIKAFSAGEVGKQVRFITEFSGAQLIITLTADWQRVVNVGTSTSTIINFLLETRGSVTANTSADVLLAFAQLETGDIATDYIPTTTAAVSVGPVSGLPRLDYLNSTCPKLLLEPQRTNLQLNSEQFDNATWAKVNTVVTANQIVSPDGNVNADKLNETTANSIHQIEGSRTVTVAAYTMSVFAKKGERNFVRLYEDTTANSAYFNLNTGAIGTVSGPTATAKIENYGNGWYRCSLTYTETGTFGRYRIVIAKLDNEAFYAGTAGNGIYIYGAQYELGAYATSYIPTLGASVTRVADACSKTGISSLIGQTQGTVFINADNRILGQTNRFLFQISDAAGNNFIALNYSSAQANTIRFYVLANGVISALTFIINTAPNLKLAVSYKNGVNKLFINGSLAYTQTGGSFNATLESIYLGVNRLTTEAIGEGIRSFQVYKTELSNAQCQELTTL